MTTFNKPILAVTREVTLPINTSAEDLKEVLKDTLDYVFELAPQIPNSRGYTAERTIYLEDENCTRTGYRFGKTTDYRMRLEIFLDDPNFEGEVSIVSFSNVLSQYKMLYNTINSLED